VGSRRISFKAVINVLKGAICIVFIVKTFHPIIYNTRGYKHMIVCPDNVRYNSNESIPYFISVEIDKIKKQGITLGNIIKNTSKFVEYLESIMEPNINFDNE
jgi:hypothetical protein